jgi:hypothetical protein
MLVLNLPMMGHKYNAVPLLSQQPPLSAAQLRSIGNIFLEHGVAHRYGIGLLHRHVSLPAGSAVLMLRDGATCAPTALPAGPQPAAGLGGAAYCLVPNHTTTTTAAGGYTFMPYECVRSSASAAAAASGVTGQHPGDVGFLEDLRAYIVAHGLARRVALTRIEPPSAGGGGSSYVVVVERLDHASRCHRYVLTSTAPSGAATGVRPTEWTFRAGAAGAAVAVATRYCFPQCQAN